jgi:hypothetical protein
MSQVDSTAIRYVDLSIRHPQEIRILKINYLGTSHMLQIFYSDNKTWNYCHSIQLKGQLAICEEGIIKNNEDRILSDLELLKTIPDQSEIQLIARDGSLMPKDRVRRFFESVLDGCAYNVQYWDKNETREVRYENPDAYVRILLKYKLNTSEHERFNEMIKTYEEIYGPLEGQDQLIKILRSGK